MFFLVLFSFVLVSSVEGQHFRQLKAHRGSEELLIYREVLSSCDDDLDYEDAWISMGIRRRNPGEGKYEVNPETEVEVAKLLEGFDTLTFKELVDLAKELRPELARDIENYMAVVTRPILVYLESAVTEVAKYINCINSGGCKTFLPKEEALNVLETKAERIVDIYLTLGEQTNDSYKIAFESVDKFINLKCNLKCVGRKYFEWMKKCSKPNQPIITHATDAYPVVPDSYVSSN